VRSDSRAVAYDSRRTHRGAPRATFQAVYRPTGRVMRAVAGTLAHWLTERYCLYAVTPGGGIRRGEIHHAPWPLQPAEAEIRANTMASVLGLTLPATPPVLHFAERLHVHVWPPARV
jgi:uncharacterized protein YqjF (DUF2071 family)